jgi:heat shock protein HslJ
MNGRKLITAGMALALLLVGCGPGPADGASLRDTRWVLVALGGEPPLAGTAPSAEFSAEEVRGSAGCNTYFGSYTVNGSEIRISDLAHTEMWCSDPEGVMDQDQAFLAALASVASYRLAGERLELVDGTGGVTLTFEPQPAGP